MASLSVERTSESKVTSEQSIVNETGNRTTDDFRKEAVWNHMKLHIAACFVASRLIPHMEKVAEEMFSKISKEWRYRCKAHKNNKCAYCTEEHFKRYMKRGFDLNYDAVGCNNLAQIRKEELLKLYTSNSKSVKKADSLKKWDLLPVFRCLQFCTEFQLSSEEEEAVQQMCNLREKLSHQPINKVGVDTVDTNKYFKSMHQLLSLTARGKESSQEAHKGLEEIQKMTMADLISDELTILTDRLRDGSNDCSTIAGLSKVLSQVKIDLSQQKNPVILSSVVETLLDHIENNEMEDKRATFINQNWDATFELISQPWKVCEALIEYNCLDTPVLKNVKVALESIMGTTIEDPRCVEIKNSDVNEILKRALKKEESNMCGLYDALWEENKAVLTVLKYREKTENPKDHKFACVHKILKNESITPCDKSNLKKYFRDLSRCPNNDKIAKCLKSLNVPEMDGKNLNLDIIIQGTYGTLTIYYHLLRKYEPRLADFIARVLFPLGMIPGVKKHSLEGEKDKELCRKISRLNLSSKMSTEQSDYEVLCVELGCLKIQIKATNMTEITQLMQDVYSGTANSYVASWINACLPDVDKLAAEDIKVHLEPVTESSDDQPRQAYRGVGFALCHKRGGWFMSYDSRKWIRAFRATWDGENGIARLLKQTDQQQMKTIAFRYYPVKENCDCIVCATDEIFGDAIEDKTEEPIVALLIVYVFKSERATNGGLHLEETIQKQMPELNVSELVNLGKWPDANPGVTIEAHNEEMPELNVSELVNLGKWPDANSGVTIAAENEALICEERKGKTVNTFHKFSYKEKQRGPLHVTETDSSGVTTLTCTCTGCWRYVAHLQDEPPTAIFFGKCLDICPLIDLKTYMFPLSCFISG